MEVNQADPESLGAGPLNVLPVQFSTPRLHKDRQCFKWSRVILSPDSINPPPRSGAASVVVQGKLYMFGVSSYSLLNSSISGPSSHSSFALGLWRWNWTIRRFLLFWFQNSNVGRGQSCQRWEARLSGKQRRHIRFKQVYLSLWWLQWILVAKWSLEIWYRKQSLVVHPRIIRY